MKKILFIILISFSSIFSQVIKDFYGYAWLENKDFIKKTFNRGILIDEKKNLLTYKDIEYSENKIIIIFIFDNNKKLICGFLTITKNHTDIYDNIKDFIILNNKFNNSNYELIETNFYNDNVYDFIKGYKNELYSLYANKNTYATHFLKNNYLKFTQDIIFIYKNKISELNKIMNEIESYTY